MRGSSHKVLNELLHRQHFFYNDTLVSHLPPFSLIQFAHPRRRMCSLCWKCEAYLCASQPGLQRRSGGGQTLPREACPGPTSSLHQFTVSCVGTLLWRVAATPCSMISYCSDITATNCLSQSGQSRLRQLRFHGERRSDDEGIPTEEGPLRRRGEECFKGQQFLQFFFKGIFSLTF